MIGGLKTGLKQLFDRLNERANEQHVNEMIRAREVCVLGSIQVINKINICSGVISLTA